MSYEKLRNEIATTLTCYAQVDDSAVQDAHTKFTA